MVVFHQTRFVPWWRDCCLVALLLSLGLGQVVVQERMSQSAHCLGWVLTSAHRYQVMKSRSLLECVTHCLPEETCRAVVYDADSCLCHLGSARSAQNCSNMEPAEGTLRFYEEHSTTSGKNALSAPSTTLTATDTTDTAAPTNTPATSDSSMVSPMDTDTPTDTDTSTALTETTASPCQHGGQLDDNGSCICVNSYVGIQCQTLMQDCTEGNNSGFFVTDGVYTIKPALSPTPFSVFCQMLELNTRTYILKRDDPTFTFNRTWHDFRHGFGDVADNFWLGLDKLHQLTISRAYQLRFMIRPNDTPWYSFYDSFVLDDEASEYNFTIGNYLSDTLDDCLSDLQGARFSTVDADNDDNPDINCAALFGGGGWYKGTNCSVCNLLGPVLSSSGQRQGVWGEMFWAGLGETYPFPLIAYLVVP